MAYNCDECEEEVKVVRFDKGKWKCDNCYFGKSKVKSGHEKERKTNEIHSKNG